MDSSLLKADIFFVVTTTAIVIIALLVVVGLGYIVNILNILRIISKQAEAGAKTVVDGLSEAKSSMQKDGYLFASLIDLFRRLSAARKNKVKTTKAKRDRL